MWKYRCSCSLGLLLTLYCNLLSQDTNKLKQLFPTTTTNYIINHQSYSLSYSTIHKQAEWVIYALTCQQTMGVINRTNNFRPDPLVLEGSAELADYKGSGYDRGHLAPASDMKISYEVMSESFLLSNITPQNPPLNRGIWLGLEERVRTWVCKDSLLYIVAGPIFTRSDPSIGPNIVTVPSFFYKIIFYNIRDSYEMIGFIFPNGPGEMDLKDYIYNTDDIEGLTGIDFFPSLPDTIENKIESKINFTFWGFEEN